MADSALEGLRVDPETPGWFNDPSYFDVLQRLRADAPVHRYAPNAWTVARYEDVRAISRTPELFCSGGGVLMNDPKRQGVELPGSVLHLDPPEHAGWRKVASRWFTPRAVAGLEVRIRELAHGLLAEIDGEHEIEAIDALAAPLPVLVIAELLGIGDDEDRRQFRVWSDACIEGADGDDLTKMTLTGELLGFLGEQTTARRRAPRDDLLTVLVQAEVDGRPLEDHEIVMYALSVLVAGNETTRHLLSGSLLALSEHPEQRAALVAETSRVPDAVEECLRWVTPIQTFGRTATSDTVIGDQPIDAGDWLVLLYASANRDETVFGPDAGAFDIHRPANPAHLAFGFGEHLCLGASLARLEARVFLDAFLARYPSYEVSGALRWTDSTLVRGLHAMPLRLG